MCKYSLEGYAFRDAREGETLSANTHYTGHSGTLNPVGESTTLACVKHETKLTIEKLDVMPNARGIKAIRGEFSRDRRFYASKFTEVPLSDKIGKRHVVTLLDGGVIETGYDYIQFEDGVCMLIMHVKRGTEFYVGEKATLEQKLELDAKTLRSVAVDMALIDPDPKPEGEKETGKETPAPVEEPATPPPAAARARRRRRVNGILV